MSDLRGKVVLVTGASRGIGAAIARAAAAVGGEVVIHYGQSADAARAVADAIGRDRCLLVQADFESDAAVTGLWRDAVAWKGRIDVLINNAGIYLPAGVDDDFETWNRVWRRDLQVNLIAAAHLCRQAVVHFREQGGGIIINMASRAAFRGDTPEYMHYAASKGGLVSLTRSIARGFAGDNVFAYALAPGFVRTDMVADFIRAHGEAAASADIPLGELVPPEEVAEIAVFLASGKARHATGTTIDINGASYMR